jgi:ferrous iron transport protein A
MRTTLEKLKEERSAVVVEIHGGYGIRKRLGNLGVHPGDGVRVVRSGFFGGPTLIEVHGTEVAIGQGMARRVEVEVREE